MSRDFFLCRFFVGLLLGAHRTLLFFLGVLETMSLSEWSVFASRLSSPSGSLLFR